MFTKLSAYAKVSGPGIWLTLAALSAGSLIGSLVPLGFLLLALATVARLAKVGRQLFGAPNKAEIPSQDQTEVSS